MRVPEYFGSMVFDDRVMKARLSGDVYRSLKQTIQKGVKLDPTVADAVAAIEARPPFAVAVNTTFVPNTRYAAHALQPGDRVEIISPVTGG